MTYDQALDYLKLSYGGNKKKGILVIKEILNKLNNPEDKLNTIHIAGTNGKGSTCAILTSVLLENNYKVGTFTSPHLEKYNERISINGINISDEDFASEILNVKNITEEYFQNNNEILSFFEILTIVAFNYFYKNNVNYAVIETGLGGKMDSTNVIIKPIVSIITSISKDHMEILGNTIEDITYEKAGIIKSNCPTILYLTSGNVYNIIKSVCDNNNSELIYFNNNYKVDISQKNLDETVFSVKCDYFEYKELSLTMIGDYQIYNAVNSLLVINTLINMGIVKKETVYSGFKKAKINGRLEIISKKPYIIIDGAHNIDGATNANKSFRNIFYNYKKTIIVGISKDKEYLKMLEILTEKGDKIILTSFSSSRCAKSEELYEFYKDKTGYDVELIDDCRLAVNKSIEQADENTAIFIVGSLYLVADCREYVLKLNSYKQE